MNVRRHRRVTIGLILAVVWLAASATLVGCRSTGVPPTAVSPSPSPSVSPLSPIQTPVAAPDAMQGTILFYRREQTGWTNIYVLDLTSGDLRKLTDDASDNYDPVWSPDGTRIAFISDRQSRSEYGTLWLMNADGSDQHPLLDPGEYFEMSPTWSPDGTRIAFQSSRGANGINQDILILDLESGEITNLTNDPALDVNPAWSPDGTAIAFASDRSGNPEIWVVNRDGTGLRQITVRPSLGDWRPAWSPDGRSLIFESYPTVAPRLLHIQSLDESVSKPVETPSVWNLWPTWMDEAHILYAASEDYDDDLKQPSPAHIYEQNLLTGEVRQLTSGEGHDSRPTWRPQ